jgi:hypothetical protein
VPKSLPAPRFNHDELWAIEEDADASLLSDEGFLINSGHWLGVVKDLCRAQRHTLDELEHERDRRLHG